MARGGRKLAVVGNKTRFLNNKYDSGGLVANVVIRGSGIY
jgi:hypothetical protein